MLVGILEADELEKEVVERFGRYADAFRQLLSGADPQLEFRTYHITRQDYPQHLDACDAYLLTGSKFSCYEDYPWIHWLKRFVADCAGQQKKLVGICFGHQLIAQALGGEVKKHDNWGIGIARSDVTHAAEWLNPDQPQFNLLVSHQDQVTRLPADAALVGTNAFCPIASYQVNHSILTFQGHPEFDRGYMEFLMTRHRSEIGEQTYQQAVQTLEQQEDHEVVAEWIVNFLRNRS